MSKKNVSAHDGEVEQGVDLNELDSALKDVLDLRGVVRGEPEKAPAAQDQKGGMVPAREIYVMEIARKADVDFCAGILWDIYSRNPQSVAFMHRAYQGLEQLMDEWVVGGSLLVMYEDMPDTKQRMLGFCGLYGVDHRHRSAWFKFVVCPEVREPGLARRAVRQFAAFALDRYGLNRLYTLVSADNKSLVQILGKMGWAQCGELAEYGFRRGQAVSALIMTAGEDTLKGFFGEEVDESGRGEEPENSDN